MTVALGRRSLYAVMAAMALALVAAMVVSATAAQAQQRETRAYCHGTGSPNNPYVLVVVQKNSQADKAHRRHVAAGRDIKLGNNLTRAEARVLFEERCTGAVTTTTTGPTPPTTTTTTPPPPTPTTTTGPPPTTTTTTGPPPTTTTTTGPPP